MASALLVRRVISLRSVNEAIAIDDGLVTHAEYQLFLDKCRAQNVWRQPDHWTGLVFPSGSGLLPAVGVLPSDALSFCAWLTERQGGTMQLRLPDLKEAVQHPLAARDFERNGTTYWVSVGGIVDPDSGYAKYSFFTVWGFQQDKRGILPDNY